MKYRKFTLIQSNVLDRLLYFSLGLMGLCVALFSPFPVHAQAPPSRQLTLISPDDSTFDAVLDKNYPGIKTLDGFDTIRPYMFLLQNDTPYNVEAYCIEFTEVSTFVGTQTGCKMFIHEHFAPAIIPESKPLRHGDLYLISAMLNLSPVDYLSDRAGVADTISAELRMLRLRGDTPSVSGKIDATIFSDGTYVGPDSHHLLERYQARRNAERDENASVLTQIGSGADEAAIVVMLQNDAAVGLRIDRSPQRNAAILQQNEYSSQRGIEAQKLLGLYKTSGLHALKARVNANVKRPVVSITPLGTPSE